MRLATILPVQFINLEAGNDYHMALAHLVPRSAAYADFFRWHSDRGDHVIMDNGVVEGDRRPSAEIVASAEIIAASEVILPDEIGDVWKTLDMGQAAINQMQLAGRQMMAVPQGANRHDWEICLQEMLRWPVDSIGFSKFIDLRMNVTNRLMLLEAWQDEIKEAGKQIHMLGSPAGAYELATIHKDYPLVRGADTGYPAFCTAANQPVRRDGRRPKEAEVDWLGTNLGWDEKVMNFNYRAWRRWIGIQ